MVPVEVKILCSTQLRRRRNMGSSATKSEVQRLVQDKLKDFKTSRFGSSLVPGHAKLYAEVP